MRLLVNVTFAWRRQCLPVVRDRLLVLPVLFVGLTAAAVGGRMGGVERDRRGIVDDCLVGIAQVEIYDAATVVRIDELGVERQHLIEGGLGVGKILLLEIGEPAAIDRQQVAG